MTNDTAYTPPDHRARRLLCSKLLAMLLDGKAGADKLGELVRVAWVEWAEGQPNPKPSWLVPWAELDQDSRDADRLIGIRVAQHVIYWLIVQLDINGRPVREFTDVEVQAIIAELEAADQKQEGG